MVLAGASLEIFNATQQINTKISNAQNTEILIPNYSLLSGNTVVLSSLCCDAF